MRKRFSPLPLSLYAVTSLMTVPSALTLKKVFRFWFPLSLNWQMMAIEGPIVTGVIARSALPEQNLAAFGVAFAWALIIESPVISLLTASAALAMDRSSYFVIRKFTWHMNLVSTVLQVIFVLPFVFNFVTNTLLNLPPEVCVKAYQASLIMIPWSAAIGYRRFYQGVTIRGGMPRRVAYGTVLRMLAMTTTAYLLFRDGTLDGASVACSALVAGVLVEAVSARIMADPLVRRLLQTEPVSKELSYSRLFKFYMPLMLTVFIGFGIQPLTTLALGRGRSPIESLAVLPVVNALVVFVMTSAFAVQEITVVLIGDNFEHLKALRSFSLLLGTMLSAILGAIVFTSLGRFWFDKIAGLPPYLVPLAFAAAQLSIATPCLRSWEAYQRALLVKAHKTRLVTAVAFVELGIVATGLFFLTQNLPAPGVLAALLSVVIGASCAVSGLLFATRKIGAAS